MTPEEYCNSVQEKDLLNKSLIPITPISENYSSLISLKDTDLNLIYEPSFIEGYNYLVRQEIVGKISRISQALEKQNKTLIIRSAWRSFLHQRKIWNNRLIALEVEYPNKSVTEINTMIARFVAPEEKSMHATGGAVDALIFDKEINEVMDFGTNKGLNIKLNDQCYPYHPDIMPAQQKNRKLLIDLFENEDFVVDLKEYWHFDYGNVIWAIEKKKNKAIYGVIKY